jgi:hypothetical protein
MKQLYIILMALSLGLQQTNAQVSRKLDSFKENVMPEYNGYFDKAEITENGLLNLSALDKYVRLSSDGKSAIMVSICKIWQDSVVLVHFRTKKELWGWNSETGSARLLDQWDPNTSLSANPLVPKPQMPVYHPWFVYIGGQLGGDNQKNVNISLNTRVGFYLLMNRWDFATTISGGRSGNVEATSEGWANIGLMSRVHFPIKKLGISPNIGGEVTLASFGTVQTTTKSLLIGISWFVGFGSVDIGVRIGSEVSTVGGLTLSPGIRNNK